MEGRDIMFLIFAVVIIVFSVLTVTSRRILRAAVSLLFVLISTAGLYFLLNYQFLAAVQLNPVRRRYCGSDYILYPPHQPDKP